jgi:hypothetical protein
MSRNINLDCLLEAFENLLAAREEGDEAKTKAAAEFREWVRAELTACAAETDPFIKRLAEALKVAARSMNQTSVRHTGVSSLGDFEQLPNPDFQFVAGVLAEAETRRLV